MLAFLGMARTPTFTDKFLSPHALLMLALHLCTMTRLQLVQFTGMRLSYLLRGIVQALHLLTMTILQLLHLLELLPEQPYLFGLRHLEVGELDHQLAVLVARLHELLLEKVDLLLHLDEQTGALEQPALDAQPVHDSTHSRLLCANHRDIIFSATSGNAGLAARALVDIYGHSPL